MTDLVDRVARAIAKELTGGFPAGPKSIDHKAAKAAIAEVVRAMGDVSPDMIETGERQAGREAVWHCSVGDIWQAMLTAWARENGV